MEFPGAIWRARLAPATPTAILMRFLLIPKHQLSDSIDTERTALKLCRACRCDQRRPFVFGQHWQSSMNVRQFPARRQSVRPTWHMDMMLTRGASVANGLTFFLREEPSHAGRSGIKATVANMMTTAYGVSLFI